MSLQSRYVGRFWAMVKRGEPNECWPWTGFVNKGGHGQTHHKYVCMSAARKAWILTHGRIEPGLSVLHNCDNGICCNPAHLRLGTRADNMIDYWGKIPPNERHRYDRRIVLTDVQLARLMRMRARGALLKDCAREFGVHIATVCRYIKEHRRRKLEALRGQAGKPDSHGIASQ